MSKRFPNNPLESGNFGDEDDSGDVLALLDRQRRNYELMEGGVEQEDASFQDRVEVANGNVATITISPDSNEKWLLFDGVTVDPFLSAITYQINADGEQVDASKLQSAIPKIVRDKVKIQITNNSGSSKSFIVDQTSREIDKFEDNK